MADLRQRIADIVENCNQTATGFIDDLNEEVDNHVVWLKEVLATAQSLNSKETVSSKRKGDILPKTPKKRKRQFKKTDCIANNEGDDLKDSETKPVIKECFVKLERIRCELLDEIDSMEDGDTLMAGVMSTKLINADVAEIESLKPTVKPAKPPRKTKRQQNKENKLPVKSLVPEGTVATQVKLYEEKIGQTPKKSVLLNQSLSDSTNSNRLKSTLPLVKIDESAVIEARATEIMISRLSYSERRSSRVRLKARNAKNIIHQYAQTSGYKKVASFRESLAACLSTTASPSFITASNSPIEHNSSEVEEIVNETQEDNCMSTTFIAQPAANSTRIASSDNQHLEIVITKDDYTSAESLLDNEKLENFKCNSAPIKTTPVISQPKIYSSLETISKTKDSISKSLTAKRFKNKTSSSAIRNPVTVKINPGLQKISIFGMKRYVSVSPTGSSYRFGSTPDKMMTPVNDNKWHEKHLELNARAESVVKKREMYLKKFVEEKKRKREEKTKKVTLERQKKEEERMAKLKNAKAEEEIKKYLRKMKLEKEKRIKAAEQLREKLRIEEQRVKEKDLLAIEMEKRATVNENHHEIVPGAKDELLNSDKNIFVQPATNTLNLNATYNAGEVMNSTYINSYEMTPKNRPQCLKNSENYDIDNLKEEDSTDDEEKPKKPIPAWASGDNLKEAIMKQLEIKINYENIFPSMFGKVNLNEIFTTRRKRFNCRTSSAIWAKPILPKTPTS